MKVRKRFPAGNHESQRLEPRIGLGIASQVSIRGSGIHYSRFRSEEVHHPRRSWLRLCEKSNRRWKSYCVVVSCRYDV
jgi:hypothetical protein